MLKFLKKRKKIKKVTTVIGEPGFTYPFGYKETDPYLFLGKRNVKSVFDITFQYGKMHEADVGWVTKVIPSEALEYGKVTFMQRQQGVSKSTEDKITGKTMVSNSETMKKSKSTDSKENSLNSLRQYDIALASDLAKSDVLIDSDLMLVVNANSADNIEKVIHELKMNYKNNDVHGIILVRRVGVQLDSLRDMLSDVHGDPYHNTDMNSISATRLFTPSSGFSDLRGVKVGTDVYSLIDHNASVIDFSAVRNAVIYMGDISPYVSIGGTEGGAYMRNGGTAVAHVLADGNYLNGSRTHHIVISKNDYHTTDSLVFDMSKESINPMEVFGSPETVEADANANFDKVTTMMLMAGGVENNDYIKNHLKKEIIDWYKYRAKGTGIYVDDPQYNPVKAQRILATEDHDNYPVPADFLLNLNNMVSEAAKSSPEEKRDAKLMYETLSTLVSIYPAMFNQPTTLPDVFKASDRNIYYDISKIGEDAKLKAISFLNILAYVTHRALPGEMIVIEGIDELQLPVESLMAYRKRMDEKNIGLITVFEHLKSKINPVSYDKFTGRLSQQDMVVLGGITQQDISDFGESWQQELPAMVQAQLLSGNRGILYFYRKADRIGAVVDTHLIL